MRKGSAEDRRRATYDAGLRAERVAALWLRLKLYKILALRYRVEGGEVDIIAKRGESIAFVEVKARPRMEEALTAITPQKRRRLSIAAARWLGANPWAANYALRGDAVCIAPSRPPRHVICAFELRLG
jgi:putative endonuclease